MEAQRKVGKYFASREDNCKCLHIIACNVYRCFLVCASGRKSIWCISVLSWVGESIHASRDFRPVGVRPKGVCLSGHQYCILLEPYSETRTWQIRSAAQNLTALMLLPNITSSDLPNCFSLAVLAVSLLLTGTGLYNLLCKHTFQSSAWTVVMALLLQVSWVGSGSVSRKGLQNRRLISSLFVYGGFGKRGSSVTARIFPLKLADSL